MIQIINRNLKLFFSIGSFFLMSIVAYLFQKFMLPSHVFTLFFIPTVIASFLFQKRVYLVFILILITIYTLISDNSFLNIFVTLTILIIPQIVICELVIWMSRRTSEKERVNQNIEANLRNFNSLLRDTIDRSYDLLWCTDLNGNYTFVNKTLCEKLLFTGDSDEPIGKKREFFFSRERELHPENPDWFTFGKPDKNENQLKAERGVNRQYEEFGNVRGKYFHVEVTENPIYETDRHIIGIIGAAKIVTGERQNEKKLFIVDENLKNIEEGHDFFCNNLNDLLLISDKDVKISYANESFYEITGYSKDDLPHIDLIASIHPDDSKAAGKILQKVHSGKTVKNFEHRIRRKDGSFATISANIIPKLDNSNNFDGLKIIGKDLSSIKRKEIEYALIEKKLKSILQSVPETICIVDENYTLLEYYSSNSEKSIFLSDNIVGKKIEKLFDEKYLLEIRKCLNEAYNSNQVVEFEYEFTIKEKPFTFLAKLKRFQMNENTRLLMVASDITKNKNILHELEESRLHFKNLLDHTYDWEYWASPEGDVLYSSPSCYEITGYSADEFMKDRNLLENIIHPDDLQAVKDHHEIYHKKNKSGRSQFRIYKKNGPMRVIRHTCCPVYDDKGNVIGRRGTNRNATNRWMAEQGMKRNEKKYRSIFNSLIDVYFEMNLDGIIEEISPSIEKLTGYKREELIHKKNHLFLESQETRRELHDQLLTDKSVENLEVNFNRKNGDLGFFAINFRLLTDEDENPIGYGGILRDTTKLKNAQLDLLRAKVEAQNYLNIAGAMIIVIGKDNKVRLINKKGFEILGYSESEIIGKDWFDNFLPDEIQIEMKKLFKTVFLGDINSLESFEYEILTKNGQRRKIHWNNSFLKDKNSKITGVLSAGTDVTKEREVLDKLLESENSLMEMNAAKDKFFSIVSHDLRSPFTSLLGYSQLALEDFDKLNKEELKTYLQSIQRVSNHIFNLIQELLEWSYIQTGRVNITPETLNVNDCIIQVLDLYYDTLKKKAIKVSNNIIKDTVIYADESAVLTIFRNLVGNAIKFTASGGKIIFETNNRDGKVMISVIDTGMGILKNDMEKLFRIDEHLTTLGTEGEKGTGLGLILCKDLLEKMDGEIWVESKVNKGSKFTFGLPSGEQPG